MYKSTALAKESFWSKVEKTDACWNWTGTTHLGYGQVYGLSATTKNVNAHRVSYFWAYGDIPAGSHIDHLCHTPACVNPGHLRLTTPKQNGEHRKGPNKNSTTGVRGVVWLKHRNKFRAAVKHNRKFITAGNFHTLAEAEAAVVALRNELFTHSDRDNSILVL